MSSIPALVTLLEHQADRLRFQIERQNDEGRPDYAALEASLQKVLRDIEALTRLVAPAAT